MEDESTPHALVASTTSGPVNEGGTRRKKEEIVFT